MTDYDIATGCNVNSLLGIAYYLGITLHIEFGSIVLSVDYGHYALAVILACDDVNALM